MFSPLGVAMITTYHMAPSATYHVSIHSICRLSFVLIQLFSIPYHLAISFTRCRHDLRPRARRCRRQPTTCQSTRSDRRGATDCGPCELRAALLYQRACHCHMHRDYWIYVRYVWVHQSCFLHVDLMRKICEPLSKVECVLCAAFEKRDGLI